jgi:hypothetical protein
VKLGERAQGRIDRASSLSTRSLVCGSKIDLLYCAAEEMLVGVAPNYILVEGQTFSKAQLPLDNHVYKNCAIDDCDVYFSGGQYELIDTHITNSRLILNHPAKGMYNAIQIFKMKSPGSSIVFE